MKISASQSTVLMMFAALIVASCVANPSGPPTVPADHLLIGPNERVQNGRITYVNEVKEGASTGSQILGTLIGVTIGSQFGDGAGQTAMAVAGGVAGNAVTNHYYGNEAEILTITLADGQTEQVKVKGNPFQQGDRVKVTTHYGMITAVVHNYE